MYDFLSYEGSIDADDEPHHFVFFEVFEGDPKKCSSFSATAVF